MPTLCRHHADTNERGKIKNKGLTVFSKPYKRGESMKQDVSYDTKIGMQGRQPIRPIDLSEAREVLGQKFADREHWMLIVHGSAVGFLIEIERRYYAREKNSDFTLITYVEGGEVFGVVAAKKRHMLGYQLISMLRQFTNVRMSEREILRRDVIVAAPGEALIKAALRLADRLLANDDLAIAP
jgi:hypothetical protein